MNFTKFLRTPFNRTRLVAAFVPKACESLLQDLLLAKLAAYEFSYSSLKLISSFLSNRKYWTKINSTLSYREDQFFGVPHG